MQVQGELIELQVQSSNIGQTTILWCGLEGSQVCTPTSMFQKIRVKALTES